MLKAEAEEAEGSDDDDDDDEAVQAPKSDARIPATQQSIIEDLGGPSDDEDMQEEPPVGTRVEDLGDPSVSE